MRCLILNACESSDLPDVHYISSNLCIFFLEFSHQTKTIYVGGLEDGIDDPELMQYFSEFGFVTRALRLVLLLSLLHLVVN